MNAIHKKRLLNVANSLRDADKNQRLCDAFTMEHWGWPTSPYSIENRPGMESVYGFDEEKEEFIPNSCGTPACALGHYASRRDLQRTFVLTKGGDVEDNDSRAVTFGMFSFPLIKNHFGIDEKEEEVIFGGEGCDNAATPLEAAVFIEDFVGSHS